MCHADLLIRCTQFSVYIFTQDTFTGTGRDGLFNGTGYAYHNVFPVLASLTFDVICIFSIALFSIMLIKFTKSRRRAAAEAANEKYRKLTAEFADTHVV